MPKTLIWFTCNGTADMEREDYNTKVGPFHHLRTAQNRRYERAKPPSKYYIYHFKGMAQKRLSDPMETILDKILEAPGKLEDITGLLQEKLPISNPSELRNGAYWPN